MEKPEVVVTGINTGEGPTWRPATRDLLVTSVMDGLVWRVDPTRGTKELFADTGGGANSSALCADGGVLVTQMGGLDFSLLAGRMNVPVVNPVRYGPPCVQRARPDGTVSVLCGLGVTNSPNDLVVDTDGSVWFTDPDYHPAREPVVARVLRYRALTAKPGGRRTLGDDDRFEVWDEFEHYVNGIALAPDGTVIVAEMAGLRRLDPATGEREWIIENHAHTDGFTVDADGRMYCCHPGVGMSVIGTDGTVLDRFPLPERAFTLNCCFGGADLRTLFVTDAGNATVLAFEGMPTPGTEVHLYP